MARLLEKHGASFDTTCITLPTSCPYFVHMLTWLGNMVNPLICAQMEACLGIITACGPSLKMLYKQLYGTPEQPTSKQPTTGKSSLTGARIWSNRSRLGAEPASLDETVMSSPPP